MPMAATISRSAASGLLIVATPVSPQYSCDSTAAVHLAQGDRSARRCASARPAQQDRPSRANASRKASRQPTLRRRNLLKSGDRESVGWGKSVSVRVDIGGGRIIKKKKK